MEEAYEGVGYGRAVFAGVEFMGECVEGFGVFAEVLDVEDRFLRCIRRRSPSFGANVDTIS